jgi:exodeoxyribonuclease VII small subunit
MKTMAKKNFEEALARLEDITQALEDGDLSLEEAMKKFDEGVKLAEFCNAKLAEAQKKVDILLKKDGALTAVPFTAYEEQDDASQSQA